MGTEGWSYNAEDVAMTVRTMKLLAKRPQLPHRLRCTQIVQLAFAHALGRQLSYRLSIVESQGINIYSNNEYGIYKVPLACAELYLAWVQPTGKASMHKAGALAGLSLETVATLAVDVFLEELRAWKTRTGSFASAG